MKKYEIWSEGYACTGDWSPAFLMGVEDAETFKEACICRFKGDKNFDSVRLTYWGCRLFDNETEARKTYG